MLNSKKHILQFGGLTVGEHQYELNVTNSFFKEYNFPEVKEGEISVRLNLLKRSNTMILDFDMSGYVKTNCDRCADEFNLPVKGTYRLVVKIGEDDVGKEDDDIIGISATESKLDISDFLYEYIMLMLPIKRQHVNSNDCNKEVLSQLENHIIEDKAKEVDPRWEKLKNIKLN